MKTAILLVNLGSPDSPSKPDVYRYLTEFLNDPRVIDLPWLSRKLLVNGLIIPLRYKNSSRIYQDLWTENGSPLIHYGKQNQQMLQKKLDASGPDKKVFLAMRYGNPSLDDVLEEIRRWNPEKLTVLPLFPQYAAASTGSVIEKVMNIVSRWWVIPEIKIISQFYDHPRFATCFADRARKLNPHEYDHILFSYHGLPERHLDKVYIDGKPCSDHDCDSRITDENQFCYKATCYQTTRNIAAELNIDSSKYTVCFQSRIGKGWIEPYSDQVVTDLAKKGMKKILIFSPAFVADCLETIIEIDEEYQELFKKHGGEKVQLVPSLNDGNDWVDILFDLTNY